MIGILKRYKVNHPLLKSYIKFFWELKADHCSLNHNFVPQRNINLRINLTETPHFLSINGNETKLDNIYFSGIYDHYSGAELKVSGQIHTFGICFYPDGFYPFIKTPLSEFKNSIQESNTMRFNPGNKIIDCLHSGISQPDKQAVFEHELAKLIDLETAENYRLFRKIFNSMHFQFNSKQISCFCNQHNITIRTFERMCNKYIGVSANTYHKISRFHLITNQLINNEKTKLTDLAYDYGYFDQMHFIRDFKHFTGMPPMRFIQSANSLLHVGRSF